MQIQYDTHTCTHLALTDVYKGLGWILSWTKHFTAGFSSPFCSKLLFFLLHHKISFCSCSSKNTSPFQNQFLSFSAGYYNSSDVIDSDCPLLLLCSQLAMIAGSPSCWHPFDILSVKLVRARHFYTVWRGGGVLLSYLNDLDLCREEHIRLRLWPVFSSLLHLEQHGHCSKSLNGMSALSEAHSACMLTSTGRQRQITLSLLPFIFLLFSSLLSSVYSSRS